MANYDSTIASYDNKINRNNQRINECNQIIRQLEDDIEELRRLRPKIINVENAVGAAARASAKKIAGLPAAIFNPLAVLKMNYFSGVLDAINGGERVKAQNAAENAKAKIDSKIRELQWEIENLRNEVRQCNSNINSLSRQKRIYISEKSD